MSSFWSTGRQSTVNNKTRNENNSVPYPYQQLDFRSDPASGVELLSKALAAGKTTRRYTTTLGEVARRQMTPEIEQEAIAHLDDPDVEVAASAVATLGRYGSAEAEQPLWDRLAQVALGVG